MKELFFDRFSYYCEHSELTLEDLILQFSRVFTLSNELKQLFKKLPINSPSQLRGEAALIALASALPLRKVLQKKWLEIPNRQVDWAATKIESSIKSQTNYLSYSPSFVVNREAAFALSTICKVWISIIENLPDEFVLNKKNRLLALRDAYQKIPNGYSNWSRQTSRIFAHNYPTETNYINVALTQWQSRKFQGSPLADQLSKWKENNSDKISPKNMESLFEWISALSIASIAHKSD